MEVLLDPDTKRRYSRLYISSMDLDTAAYCLNMVIKKAGIINPGKDEARSISSRLFSQRR